MVSHEHLQNVMEYVRLGEEQGARLIFGGRETSPVKGGAYMMPTIFDQVKNEMRIAQEEIFGPVLAVISVGDAREAIQTANDSAYGLAAAVFCDEINLAFQVARRIRAGLVHINSYGEDNITAPFGGYKQSGNGTKDKAVHALHDYMAVKTTWLGLQPI